MFDHYTSHLGCEVALQHYLFMLPMTSDVTYYFRCAMAFRREKNISVDSTCLYRNEIRPFFYAYFIVVSSPLIYASTSISQDQEQANIWYENENSENVVP